ncbi:MAG: SusC/RagA family TonB-linked outer membrane protein [Bacteroidaceae bacterium]|nr:SusC/RagA family TonB-linked outer membrane protein [Bacteroidaceae bacterium]
MKTINIILFILCTSFFTSKAFAQEENAELREIKGKVIDAATKSPASGIKVVTFNDRRYTAMTNEEGEYTIKVPKYATSLTFSAEGYNLIQQPIRNGVQPTVSMYSDKFQEIYSATTSAVSKKTAKVTYNNNDISIDNQIQQSLGSDLYSRMRSGTPGVGNMILMNGLNSLNANAQPLVVIDGVIQYMQYDQNSLHDGFFNNILANIMVEDIEKISVLKNGTAIYGSQGANGVLIIETKRNKSMATKIDVSIGGTYELTPNTPEMMNANDFRIYASELIGTTGTKKNSFKFLQTDPKYYYYNQYHNHTDWSKQVYDEAFTQNYSINVQGGDDVANYNLSVGYAKADATIKDNDFDRFNLRLNSDIVLSKKINIRFDASYSDVTRDMRDDGASANLASNNARYGVVSAPGFLSLIKSPFLSPYAYDTNGEVTHFLAGADDYLSDVLSKESWRTSLANPVSILDNGEGDNKNYFGNRIINIAVTPKWDINKNWSIAEHFSFQIVNTDENYYLPRNGVPHYEVENAGVVENQVSALSGRYIGIMSDTYFNYDHRRNANKLNVRGGFRYINNNYKLNTQIGYNSGNDKTPNMSSSLLYKSIDGTEDKSINMNYYLTGDYNYRERYYLFAGLSLNGSSKFGRDAADGIKIGNYAWGLFTSLELAWVMSNEDWFNIKGIDYLKLNAGFDSSGNDNVNPIANRTYFVAGKLFNNIGTLTIGNIGNTKLQWETTDRFTLGAQLAAFKNRLFVGFNYFFANTRNLLRLNDLSYLSGLYTNWKNDGRLQNQGFDVSANWKVLSLKDWKWDITLSAGHYKNEVKRLPNDTQSMTTPLYGATILTEVGKPANLFFGYRTNGVFSTNDEARQAGKYILSETGDKVYFEAGDMKIVDSDGNNIINEQDMQVIGDPNPDLYGNISTTLSWKRFTLSLLFNYSLGNDIYNYQRSILESGSYFYNQTIAMSRRWTHEGQLTDIPRASYLDRVGNSRFSDRWIEDGSYLKFKTLSLSYDIPITNTYLQGITIWGAANNLFTITKYLGGDPEFSAFNSIIGMGIDRGLLGRGTNFALGVKINL